MHGAVQCIRFWGGAKAEPTRLPWSAVCIHARARPAPPFSAGSGEGPSLFPTASRQNFCYISVDPARRLAKVWYHAWQPYW